MTSYSSAGVDLAGARRHVESIAEAVTSTWTEDVVGGFGGFAAGIRIPSGYEDPILMMSTDGVGTKLEVARLTDKWEGVGFDLVAMCVDDLAAVGARSIGFVDYLAVGSLDAERDQTIVRSIADACAIAGCPLLGGETAEHPGVMDPDAVDLAGAVVGVVENGSQLGPDRVRPGQQVIGLQSPNLRSNGFSLVRSILADELKELADLLLSPSVIYSPSVLDAAATGAVASAGHITGGGLVENLDRALGKSVGADIDTSTWIRPGVFDLIAEHGVPSSEMLTTFNLGVGFCLIVSADRTDEVLEIVSAHEPTVIGEVSAEPGIRIK